MTRVNRSLLLKQLMTGEPLRNLVNRAVGKTTSAMLVAVGESYNHPGKWVEVLDPDIPNTSCREDLIRQIRSLCAKLNLDQIEVRSGPYLGERGCTPPYRPEQNKVYVRNTFCESLV